MKTILRTAALIFALLPAFAVTAYAQGTPISDKIGGAMQAYVGKMEEILSGIHPTLGGFAIAMPFLTLLAVYFLLYKTVFKSYQRFLLRRYGFKIMGIPAHFTMICYFLVIGLPSLFGIGTDIMSSSASGLSETQQILALLAVGAPGMLWQLINCLIKTKNILIALFNLIIMYWICFFMGYLYVAVVGFLILAFFLKLMFTPGSYACPRCGTRVSGSGTCPGCGVNLVT